MNPHASDWKLSGMVPSELMKVATLNVVVWSCLLAATIFSGGCGSSPMLSQKPDGGDSTGDAGPGVPDTASENLSASDGFLPGLDAPAGNASEAGEGDSGLPSDGGDSDARIYRGDPGPSKPYDLRLVGSGFDLLEGALVTFRIGSPTSSYHLGVGQTRVSGGGFDVLFAAVMERIYKPKVVLIDSNKSGGCDDGDDMWTDAGLYQMDMTLTIKPGDIRFRKMNSRTCRYYFADWPLD